MLTKKIWVTPVVWWARADQGASEDRRLMKRQKFVFQRPSKGICNVNKPMEEQPLSNVKWLVQLPLWPLLRSRYFMLSTVINNQLFRFSHHYFFWRRVLKLWIPKRLKRKSAKPTFGTFRTRVHSSTSKTSAQRHYLEAVQWKKNKSRWSSFFAFGFIPLLCLSTIGGERVCVSSYRNVPLYFLFFSCTRFFICWLHLKRFHTPWCFLVIYEDCEKVNKTNTSSSFRKE